MEKIIALIVLVVLLAGCTQPSTLPVTSVETTEEVTTTVENTSLEDVIELCDSLCYVDSEAYCVEERTITVNEEEMTGTCRSFSHKDAVEGFNRCQGFCTEYGKLV